MKKLIFVFIIILMAFALVMPAFAENESVGVFVTIANGSLVLAREPITVTDTDGDGKLTLNDALYLAHEAKYPGGASDGYSAVTSDYGLSMAKLWGVDNGGGYGYYINNGAVSGLLDQVNDDDIINAFVYTDLTAYSDTFCFFDVGAVSSSTDDEFTLTLFSAGYDANWQFTVSPLAGAAILIDGEKTDYVTAADGTVTIKADSSCVISASSDTQNLVPPSCVFTSIPNTGDFGFAFYAVAGILALSVIAYIATRRKNTYEE